MDGPLAAEMYTQKYNAGKTSLSPQFVLYCRYSASKRRNFPI